MDVFLLIQLLYSFRETEDMLLGMLRFKKEFFLITASGSLSVAINREFIVKPEKLARLSPAEVYILDRNACKLAYTTLR